MAARSCSDCRLWLYDQTGAKTTRSDGKQRIPLYRPNNAPTPCGTCEKIPPREPVKSWRNAANLSQRMIKAFRFYEECRAIGQFPDDPIVRWYGRLFMIVRESVQSNQGIETLAALMGVADRGS